MSDDQSHEQFPSVVVGAFNTKATARLRLAMAMLTEAMNDQIHVVYDIRSHTKALASDDIRIVGMMRAINTKLVNISIKLEDTVELSQSIIKDINYVTKA